MKAEPESPASSNVYPSTSWTVIVKCQQGDSNWEEAARTLFERYRAVVTGRFRKCGFSDPEDWCSQFMADVFFPKVVSGALRESGRFRGFLGICLYRFMVSVWRKRTLIRGGNPLDAAVSLDAQGSAPSDPAAPPTQESVQVELDRELAVAVVNLALAEVKTHYQTPGKMEQFALFADFSGKGLAGRKYAEVARDWGTTENNVKQRARTFRFLLNQAVREEVRKIAVDGEVEAEMKYLLSLLRPEDIPPPEVCS